LKLSAMLGAWFNRGKNRYMPFKITRQSQGVLVKLQPRLHVLLRSAQIPTMLRILDHLALQAKLMRHTYKRFLRSIIQDLQNLVVACNFDLDL
ncbi:hypothetical protein ALC53_10049, partial [Atta colombica]